jgi:hypothetical protein
VRREGRLEWDIEPAAAKRLLAELVRARITQLDPRLSATVTDLPAAQLEGRLEARSFSLRHYGAGSEIAERWNNSDSKTANRLERLIDLISKVQTRVVGCAGRADP